MKYCLVGMCPKVAHAPKTAAHKKHPMNILHEEKYVHRIIVLALPKLNIAFKTTKWIPNGKYQILKSQELLSACLPACLITFERLKAKRRNTWSPNLAIITNSLWNVPFWVPKFVYPLRLISFFFNLRIMIIFFFT